MSAAAGTAGEIGGGSPGVFSVEQSVAYSAALSVPGLGGQLAPV